ncbi:biotin carboxyl carrier protein [Micromonospora profundi]|uniref:biotin/lipoyl-binding carrier protein n=1 Tax=Micromonospora profundi TaxID=1420889 RepID=UPI00143A4E6D|nr:biotin/lipoyl-binding carrier protein [Micromonospora profundi]NJC12962.1 biotin carboxyl carrier protein [Micromonospora profundi]
MTELRAEMVANVWKVLVQPGQQVAADEDLVILESMKMEIPMVAPSAGTVASVHVTEGSQVAENDLLVVLEG